MSTRTDLATLHTRVACVQAECALWQIRRQWEYLLATTKGAAKLVQERNPGTSPESSSSRDDLLAYILSNVSEKQADTVVRELASKNQKRMR